MINATPEMLDTASETFIRLLERFAFMFAERVETGIEPAVEGPLMRARILFECGDSGLLEISASMPFAVALASNALGVDPDDAAAADDAADAFKELLNLFCGHFITDVLNQSHNKVEISPPMLEACTAEEWRAQAAMDSTAGFCIDGEHPLLLHFAAATGQLESKSCF